MCWPDTSENSFNCEELSLWIFFFTRCADTSLRPVICGRPDHLTLRMCAFGLFKVFIHDIMSTYSDCHKIFIKLLI